MTKRSMGYFSLLTFFGSLQFYLTIYINSSVITQTLGSNWITPIFVVSAFCSIILFLYAPHILSRIGNRWFFVLLTSCAGLALLSLSRAPTGVTLFVALSVYLACIPVIGFSLDIFFERRFTEESSAGTSRGLFLTAGNAALVLSPLCVSVLAGLSFSHVYLASVFFIILFLLISLPLAHSFTDPTYTRLAFRDIPRAMTQHVPVIGSQIILRLFYAFAAIYMPLLLVARGFTWGEIGLILAVALLPFMLFELPLGRVADTLLGEREMLIGGFVILASTTALLSITLPHSVVLYAALFFATRTGAAMVEITTETNFFRSVGAKNAESITLFRMTQPIGYVLGALIGAAALIFIDLNIFFLLVGFIVLLGLPFALRITDSR